MVSSTNRSACTPTKKKAHKNTPYVVSSNQEKRGTDRMNKACKLTRRGYQNYNYQPRGVYEIQDSLLLDAV